MKITLIRHAKSSWEENCKDFHRPIIEIGKNKSIKVAENYKNEIKKNVVIYSSSAKRAKETSEIFAKVWSNTSKINYQKELYTFDVYELEKFIKNIDNQYSDVLIFGHNNALTDFVNKFGDIFIENIPTSGLVSIKFEENTWANIKKGKTIKILFPRNL